MSRELDAKVAEALGLPELRRGRSEGWEWVYRSSLGDTQPVPHYSTDIAAAWQVVEKLMERGELPSIAYLCGVDDDLDKMVWEVWLRRSNAYAHAEALPEAICLAALAAIGGDK